MSDTPDLDRAREGATDCWLHLGPDPVKTISRLILKQRLEEAKYCASITPASAYGPIKERAADLRRQAKEWEVINEQEMPLMAVSLCERRIAEAAAEREARARRLQMEKASGSSVRKARLGWQVGSPPPFAPEEIRKMPESDPIEQQIAEIEAEHNKLAAHKDAVSLALSAVNIPWLIAQLREARESNRRLAKWVNLGGAPTGKQCHYDQKDVHEIHGGFHSETADGSNAICDVHLLQQTVTALRKAEQERDALAIRCSEQENAIRNQRGDDLCWIQNPENAEVAKVMTEAEFLESCRRFHAQMGAERGIFTAGRTIAQLEADNATLTQENNRLKVTASIEILKKAEETQGKNFLEEFLRLKQQRDEAWRDSERLRAQLNTPEVEDFDKAIPLEAVHQLERWGSEHDAGKTPADWFWLVGYLAGKALAAHGIGNLDKAKHHCISTAAVLRNWHAAIRSGGSVMRPGIAEEKTAALAALSEPSTGATREANSASISAHKAESGEGQC